MPVAVVEAEDVEDERRGAEAVRVVSVPVVGEQSCKAVVSGSLKAAQVVIVTCCGVRGGTRGPMVEGPEGAGLYDTLEASERVAVVQVEYRKAGSAQFAGNIADALAVVDWVGANGGARVGVIGHSQGGAVAFQVAAQRSRQVRGVCALASQTKGVPPSTAMKALVGDAAMRVAVLHGDGDEILKSQCARDIAKRCGYAGAAAKNGGGGGGGGLKGSVALEILKGGDHQFKGKGREVRAFVDAWIGSLAASQNFLRRSSAPAPAAPAPAPAPEAYAAAKENDKARRSAQRYLNFIFVADEVLDDADSASPWVGEAREAVADLRRLVTNSAAAAAGNALDADETDEIDAARGKAAERLRAAGLDGEMRRRLRRDKPARHALLHQVLDGLYVGGWAALNNDCEVLRARRITRVVSVVSAAEPRKLGAFVTDHLHVVCHDNPDALLCVAFPAIARFVERGRKNKENVYVHCGAGVSRACTATCAYLMWKGDLSCAEGMRLVKAARPQARPNVGFLHQLHAWHGVARGVALDDDDGARPTTRNAANGCRVAVVDCGDSPGGGGT